MKTAVIHLPASLETLAIEARAEPAVAAGSVKVRWHALSLNFHDYAVIGGLLPAAEGRVPISDGAGEVVEVGVGVSRWKPGDQVMSTFFPDWFDGEPDAGNTRRLGGDTADGCAAEYGIVSPEAITAIPSGYSFAEAATLPCAALTAWRALVEVGGIKPGDRVLVEGSGGVSIFALQFAKALGATVYATSSSPEKCERLRRLGADHTVDYSADCAWGATIAKHSGGGVDHVIDIGGGATLAQSIEAARIGGSVVMVGLLGGMEATVNVARLMLKQPRIRPVAVGNHAMQLRMVKAIEAHGLRPVIDSSFPFAKLAEALRYQLSGRHLGKIVIDLAA